MDDARAERIAVTLVPGLLLTRLARRREQGLLLRALGQYLGSPAG